MDIPSGRRAEATQNRLLPRQEAGPGWDIHGRGQAFHGKSAPEHWLRESSRPFRLGLASAWNAVGLRLGLKFTLLSLVALLDKLTKQIKFLV